MARQVPYSEPIDLQDLAEQFDNLTVLQNDDGYVNFKDPKVHKAVTRAILEVDFGLKVQLPDDRLCPPVPNRFNYVRWIQDLIDQTSPQYTDKYDPEREVIGLDIGTGAAAIYALLALKTRSRWKMCVTDIDKKSLECAKKNLALNNLHPRTRAVRTTALHPLIPLKDLGVDRLDFIICNPPFFTSEEDMRKSTEGQDKKYPPHANCTGTTTEMVCPGGDFGFVSQILQESLVLQEKIQWYSSMLGKLESAYKVITLLRKYGVENYAVGIIDTGGRTRRWIVAWSFGDLRPRNELLRPDRFEHEYLAFPTRYQIPLAPNQNPEGIQGEIFGQLASLDMEFETTTGVGVASQNVWNRKYRFLKKKAQEAGLEVMATDNKVGLVFRVSSQEKPKEICIDWLRGHDQAVWESFCGFVHRLVRDVTAK
ncbi:hypothetical protein BCR34DRAFT_472566 [Clohesyomyces aquaticus]|uniref:Uncharacterized protein n=1 Tax=Clohesyomyces aquaticus TaxID=1231657 RepID=A0A1Y2A8U4_9PLEO|nr:hypothetical protein BCR34DRAFT_472566 [Clohesyomyces aquaticus]